MFWNYYNGYNNNIWAFFDTFAYNFGLIYDSTMTTYLQLNLVVG
jgi:hypothetical protein